MQTKPVPFAAMIAVLAVFQATKAAVQEPTFSEWHTLAQVETLDVFFKDRPVGRLVHAVSALDGTQTIVSATALSVAGRDAGVGSLDIFEQRVYGADGRLRSARQTLKSASGTNKWSLFKSPQGWRLNVETGGEATARIIDDFNESLVPTLEMTKKLKRMLIATGETWRDTQIELVSGKIVTNLYRCTSVDTIGKIVTFDVTDNITGRHQTWLIDASGKTVLQEIEGIFVAKRAVRAERGAKKDESGGTDLSDLISVSASRPAAVGERIAVVLGPGDSLDATVAPFYKQNGNHWVLTAARCTCASTASADTSQAVFTRPTATLQSDHPSIAQLARRLTGTQNDPCAITQTLNRYVFQSLEKRATATFSNALETLKAGFGDCGEHAVLLAALLRSRGIPARVVLGLIYVGGKKAYAGHAWVMVWTGSWVFADPAFGVFPACWDRVPLIIDDSGQNAVNLMKLIGRIKIEYVADK